MAQNTESDPPIPVACTLSADRARFQVQEWVDLQALATSTQATRSGASMVFPSSLAPTVEDLARRERTCCGFLTITTVLVGDELTLEITTADREALPVIAALTGVEIS